MTQKKKSDPTIEETWRTYLTTGKTPPGARQFWYLSKRFRPIARSLPHSPRCRICYYPFEGIGGKMAKLFLGLEPSKMNPHLCNACERFARTYNGGAEIETTMVFADIRGSTAIAESVSPTEFSKTINRFYRVTTEVLYNANGMVEKLLGDEVTGFFVSGFAGPDFTRVAVEAGRKILQVTGHDQASGPWVPVGIGIHTGIAYVGAVNAAGGGQDISILGDSVNIAARLASLAGPGEILTSEATRLAANLSPDGMEPKRLKVKGRKQAVDAWTMKIKSNGKTD